MADRAETVACTCAHLADDRKADDVLVLEVGGLTVLTDYFVISTGRNERHVDAIARAVRQRMDELDHALIGVEGDAASGWVLIDLADVIVHIFAPDTRELYDLERLWGDAPSVDWQEVAPLSSSPSG